MDIDIAGGHVPDLAPASSDERRLQVQAYNLWTALLGPRRFPDFAQLTPQAQRAFGDRGVVIESTGGVDNPRIARLGSLLAQESGAPRAIRHVADVPERSLLARITDQYRQVMASGGPVGFEAEFVDRRGATIVSRGILLPFSRDDARIDHIWGVISWKERDAAPTADPDPVKAEAETLPPMLRPSTPVMEAPYADTPWPDVLGSSASSAPAAAASPERPLTGSPADALMGELRAMPVRPLAGVASAGSEFTVLIARRMEDGRVMLVGEVDGDPAVLHQAALRLLDTPATGMRER